MRRILVYVSNRVQRICDHTSPEQWHHVPGKDNPADKASLSLTASQLLDNKRWFRGPEFLWEDNVPLLHSVKSTQLPMNDVEVRAKVLNTVCLQPLKPTGLLAYIHCTLSWYKAKTSVAWMRRAIVNLQSARSARRARKVTKVPRCETNQNKFATQSTASFN